jgi:hypothetical protein
MIGRVEDRMPFDRPHRRRFIALLRRCGGSVAGLGAQQAINAGDRIHQRPVIIVGKNGHASLTEQEFI